MLQRTNRLSRSFCQIAALSALAVLLLLGSADAASVGIDTAKGRTLDLWEFVIEDWAVMVDTGSIVYFAPPGFASDLESATGGTATAVILSQAIAGLSASVTKVRFEGGAPDSTTVGTLQSAGFPNGAQVTASPGFSVAFEYTP